MKKFIVFLLLILFASIFPKKTLSQGTCLCEISFDICALEENNCDVNHIPQCTDENIFVNCQGFVPQSCTCVLPPTPAPTPPGGTCDPGENCCECDGGNVTDNCDNNLNFFCLSQNGGASSCICTAPPTPAPTIPPFQPSPCVIEVCSPFGTCNDIEGIQTGIGCLPTHPLDFVQRFQNILVALGSGIVLLLMIIGAFFIMTSQGQPERVKRGRELLTGGIIGLLFMIFAVFLLKLILEDITGLF